MTKCLIDECTKPVKAKWYCNAHYLRLIRHGNVLGREKITRLCKFSGCKNKHDAMGYCKAHYGRLRRTGKPEGIRTAYNYDPHKWVLDHLYYEGNDCIAWPYSKHPFGYGQINIDGIPVYVHTLMATILYGPKPSDYHQAAHSCGNGNLGCVNPKHLRWASRLENEADKIIHGTNGKKLNTKDAIEIYSIHNLSHKKIASIFGVSKQNVTKIKNGKIWNRVTGIVRPA